VLVVIGMWSLLARMGSHKKQQVEAERYLTFLVSAAPMSVRERDEEGVLCVGSSDVPLYVIYVFMAWHLKNRFQSVPNHKKDDKAKFFSQFNAILVEAFILHQVRAAPSL
jgi:hypothetical protein